MILIPNIGVEFDVKNVTWNRWTVGLNLRYNWQTSHTYKPDMVYNLFEVRLEGRQYWRARQIGGNPAHPAKHNHFYDRVFSIRRSRVKHPRTTWYRGVFASYMKYSFKLGAHGHQGDGVMLGVSYGFIRPMYAFANGNSLDLEIGASVGALVTKNFKYTYDAESDCYPVESIKGWHLVNYPVINDIHVGIVYRFGQHPVTSKYRYRMDVDSAYFARHDSMRIFNENIKLEKTTYKDQHEKIIREFWHVYDSIAAVDRAKGIMDRPVSAKKGDGKEAKAEKQKKEKKNKKSKKGKKGADESPEQKNVPEQKDAPAATTGKEGES